MGLTIVLLYVLLEEHWVLTDKKSSFFSVLQQYTVLFLGLIDCKNIYRDVYNASVIRI